MTSTEIEQINTKDGLIAKLIIGLANFKKIEESITYLVDACHKLYQTKNCFLALINEEGLLIQAQAKAEKLETNFDININPFNALLKLETCICNNYIYLPLRINQQLFAVLVLIFEKEKAQSYYQALKTELELIAKEVSIFISLNQQITDLQALNEKLLRQDQLKSQLISTISHELRTPMTNILGFSELLKGQTFTSSEQKKYNEEIYNSALRLANLIDNFLDLSRIDEGHELELNHLEEVELDWLAERAWSMLGAINQNHKINWQIKANLPKIMVDSDAITRVLLNLFNNAIKYSGKSREITCNIEHQNQEIIVSVIDQGIGIAKSELTRIFERFYRVENKEGRHISGTGLGLWISKKIIEAHGGRIWCESDADTCFKFTLQIGAIENAKQIILH